MRVCWVQGLPGFADLRMPLERPSFSGVRSLEDCDAEQRLWLGRQEGFAGRLIKTEEGWVWNREVDFAPRAGKRDIGKLEFIDETRALLREDGMDEPYVEIWERMDRGESTGGKSLVLKLGDAQRGERGFLVALGGYFILAVDRRGHHPDPLNMEISLGNRDGAMSQWMVRDSTFPWREGKKLFDGTDVVVDWKKRSVRESRAWLIVEPANGHLDWAI
jgi:hypothetical protein